MKTTSLLALIVDQHAGELTPEVAELLTAYLADHPDARAEAARIQQALSLTADAMNRHPELARVDSLEPANSRPAGAKPRPFPAWLAKAASIALLASLAGAGGYFAGRRSSPPAIEGTSTADASSRPSRKDSPWARYRFASDGGGMQIVRVDAPKSTEGTLQ
jgi:anti-sigma factor RsiW